MKTIQGYQCEVCSTIYEDLKSIYQCKNCDKEICGTCCAFIEDLCWKCNDEVIERLDAMGL